MLKSRMYSERYSTFAGTTAPPKDKTVHTLYEMCTQEGVAALIRAKGKGVAFRLLLAVK